MPVAAVYTEGLAASTASESSTAPSTPAGPKPGPPRNVSVQRVAQGHAISWVSPLNRTVPAAYYYIEYRGSADSDWKHWGPIKETSFLGRSLFGCAATSSSTGARRGDSPRLKDTRKCECRERDGR